MHGGADGSGAPKGPKNGNYKHGRYTKEVAATRRWLREAIDTLRAQHEERNFKMAQNVKLAESKEIRARAMNKADVCRQLHNAAEFHLFGAGQCANNGLSHFVDVM
jgi:hypothetical protein